MIELVWVTSRSRVPVDGAAIASDVRESSGREQSGRRRGEDKVRWVEVRLARRPSHRTATSDPSCGICGIQEVLEKCWGSIVHKPHVSLDGERNGLQQTGKHFFQEDTVCCAGQTVWQDIKAYYIITKGTCPNVHGKFLLVLTRDSAVGIAVRPNVFIEQVEMPSLIPSLNKSRWMGTITPLIL
ncbi:hypothetical protein AVEN_190557-1 [Araneus ventricosus]|uniref:Uncharacterized protein n=1 Tax=Araneus ventricosus TaxID=182803 RepID=A0A4Y2CE74_ARAVE|nr:hypothetical protein AVEN_190557-1 [Araneus ventricosus]